jgi:hypothetical protein
VPVLCRDHQGQDHRVQALRARSTRRSCIGCGRRRARTACPAAALCAAALRASLSSCARPLGYSASASGHCGGADTGPTLGASGQEPGRLSGASAPGRTR